MNWYCTDIETSQGRITKTMQGDSMLQAEIKALKWAMAKYGQDVTARITVPIPDVTRTDWADELFPEWDAAAETADDARRGK